MKLTKYQTSKTAMSV